MTSPTSPNPPTRTCSPITTFGRRKMTIGPLTSRTSPMEQHLHVGEGSEQTFENSVVQGFLEPLQPTFERVVNADTVVHGAHQYPTLTLAVFAGQCDVLVRTCCSGELSPTRC